MIQVTIDNKMYEGNEVHVEAPSSVIVSKHLFASNSGSGDMYIFKNKHKEIERLKSLATKLYSERIKLEEELSKINQEIGELGVIENEL